MFTVCIINHALQSGSWRGTFETQEAATVYAVQQAGRSRGFVEFQVCRGTPKSPGQAVGPKLKGRADD